MLLINVVHDNSKIDTKTQFGVVYDIKQMTEKQLLKKIGLRIKQLRQDKGLSQLEFSYKIDAEKSNVSRLESGQFNTKIYTLFKVAEALETDLSDLLKLDK